MLYYYIRTKDILCHAKTRVFGENDTRTGRVLRPGARGWHNIYTKTLTSPLDWKMIIYVHHPIQFRCNSRTHSYLLVYYTYVHRVSDTYVCGWTAFIILWKGIFLSSNVDMCSPSPRSAIVCHSVLGESFAFRHAHPTFDEEYNNNIILIMCTTPVGSPRSFPNDILVGSSNGSSSK